MQPLLHFPDPSAVVREEAAAFRGLSPAEKVATIRSVVATGSLLIAHSPKRAFLEAHHEEQEAAARRAFKDFVARHADRS
jgi:hypothetical protein